MGDFNFNKETLQYISGIQDIIEKLGGESPGEKKVWSKIIQGVHDGEYTEKDLPNIDEILVDAAYDCFVDILHSEYEDIFNNEHEDIEISHNITSHEKAIFCINDKQVHDFDSLKRAIGDIRESIDQSCIA